MAAAEAPATAAPAGLQARLLYLLILLLVMTDYLQSGMVAFAAAPIMGELGAAPEEYSLVVAAYAAVAIVVISQQRWLVERIGWRVYVGASLPVFAAGALVCAGSHTLAQFFAGRMVMAAGGAAFVTAARVMINLFPGRPQRFRGIWYYATGLTLGLAGAPLFASVAVTRDTWSATFEALAALSLVIGIVSSLCLPRIPVPAAKTVGSPALVALLAAGSFAVLYAFQRSAFDFYSDAPWLALAVLAGAGALAWTARRLALRPRALLDTHALAGRRYVSGLALYLFCYTTLGANNYAIPFLLQRALGLPWEVVGRFEALALIPSLLAWWLTARILPRWPAAGKFYLVGFAALFLFAWRLSGLSPDVNLERNVLPALMGNGLFLAMVLVTAAVQTFKDVSYDDAMFSHAQQVKNMLSQLGIAAGTALATVGLQWRVAQHYASLNGNFLPGNPALVQSQQALGGDGALARLAQGLVQQSVLLSALDYFALLAVVALAGGVVMTLQKTLK